MKDKIVFWGTNQNEEKILITLRLRLSDDRVDIWTFPEKSLKQDFIDQMFQDWNNIDVDNFPQPHSYLERTMGEQSLLPDEIKANDTEIVRRAEEEWYVQILSAKLKNRLQEQVRSLLHQVEAMETYDKEVWAITKSFWDKVSEHYQARDLNKEHAGALRDKLNLCFKKLKLLMEVENKKYEAEAQNIFDEFVQKIEDIKPRISPTNNLKALFGELNNLQKEANKAALTGKLRHELKKHFDEVFTELKAIRKSLVSNKLNRRINGLQKAIDKMQRSLDYDLDSLNFQESRMKNAGGKLEMQLREAKIKMISSKVDSKQTKLDDMHKTLNELKEELKKEMKREQAQKHKKGKQENKKQTKESKSGKKLVKKISLKDGDKSKPVKEEDSVQQGDNNKEAGLASPETETKSNEVQQTEQANSETDDKSEEVQQTEQTNSETDPKSEEVQQTEQANSETDGKSEEVEQTEQANSETDPKSDEVQQTEQNNSEADPKSNEGEQTEQANPETETKSNEVQQTEQTNPETETKSDEVQQTEQNNSETDPKSDEVQQTEQVNSETDPKSDEAEQTEQNNSETDPKSDEKTVLQTIEEPADESNEEQQTKATNESEQSNETGSSDVENKKEVPYSSYKDSQLYRNQQQLYSAPFDPNKDYPWKLGGKKVTKDEKYRASVAYLITGFDTEEEASAFNHWINDKSNEVDEEE